MRKPPHRSDGGRNLRLLAKKTHSGTTCLKLHLLATAGSLRPRLQESSPSLVMCNRQIPTCRFQLGEFTRGMPEDAAALVNEALSAIDGGK